MFGKKLDFEIIFDCGMRDGMLRLGFGAGSIRNPLIMKRMNLDLTCKKATEYIVQREEGKLSFMKRILLWKHMGICGLCKLFSKQSRLISRNAPHLHQHINDSLSQPEKDEIIAGLQEQ